MALVEDLGGDEIDIIGVAQGTAFNALGHSLTPEGRLEQGMRERKRLRRYGKEISQSIYQLTGTAFAYMEFAGKMGSQNIDVRGGEKCARSFPRWSVLSPV